MSILILMLAAAVAAQPVPPVLSVAPMPNRPAPQATAPAAAPTPAAPSPTLIEKPDWVRRPGGDSATRFFPDRAARLEIEGRVVMLCHVRNDGLLGLCEILEETPPGYDFGAAALKMAPLFRMRPLNPLKFDVPGDSGFTVRVPIFFKRPEPAPPEQQEVTAEVMLDDYVQCFGVVGADLDADPTRRRLIPALNHLKKSALGVSVYAEVDADTVRARLDAARAKPTTDEAFGRTCRALVEEWLASR